MLSLEQIVTIILLELKLKNNQDIEGLLILIIGKYHLNDDIEYWKILLHREIDSLLYKGIVSIDKTNLIKYEPKN